MIVVLKHILPFWRLQRIGGIELQLHRSGNDRDSHDAFQIHLEHDLKQFGVQLSIRVQEENGPRVQMVFQMVTQAMKLGYFHRTVHLVAYLGLGRRDSNILTAQF
jgi:hypothetical protein